MNFKPALCPSCGGKMQMPDDVNTVKCMYCGVDVLVREAIKLAGRTKEFTEATAIEQVIERKPYAIETAKKHTFIMIAILGGIGLMMFLCAGGFDSAFGVIMGLTFLIVLSVVSVIRYVNFQKAVKAYEKTKNQPPTKIITGYKGECPYCSTSITLKANAPGDNCRACQKRIVIRDSKFYSVETPVGGLSNQV
jgi:hypothetical protein